MKVMLVGSFSSKKLLNMGVSLQEHIVYVTSNQEVMEHCEKYEIEYNGQDRYHRYK